MYSQPLKVYLAISVITALIYLCYLWYKGEYCASSSLLSSTACGVIVCACVVQLLCDYVGDIGGWVCVVLLTLSSMSGLISQFA